MEAVEALLAVLRPERLGWLLTGTGLGLVIGLLPGLGGVTGLSILLPFIYGMDPVAGVAMLVGMAAVVHTSDTFPSVLIGVPGTAGSQATVVDGYPLARQGEAARALGASFVASMIGGIVGAVTLWLVLPVARPIILMARSPELFMLTLFGLSMVSVVSHGSQRTGLLSGALGLALGAVGASPAVPEYRYTFGSVYLSDGIPLTALALGLFGLPEVLDLVATRQTIARAESIRGGRVMSGVRDALRHKTLIISSGAIGTLAGIIPGLGGSVAGWIAYGVARRFCKGTQNFGGGDLRGVIAPESANNAKEGGSLIPALLLGIPSSGLAAVLLSGLLILGIEVGPRMLAQDLSITLSIVWALVLANVAGAIACLLCARWISKLTLLPSTRWFPFLIVCLVVASYQSSRHWADVLVLLAFGVVGIAMKFVDWSRVPLLIGFVLSHSSERYLHISISRYGAEWLLFPSVLGIGIAIILILIGSGANRLGGMAGEPGKEARPPGGAGLTNISRSRLVVDALVLVFFLFLAGASLGFQRLARHFPLYICLASAVLAALHLALDAFDHQRANRTAVLTAGPAEPNSLVSTGRYFCWVLAFALLFCVAGLPIAVMAFVPLFLRYEAGVRWRAGLASAVLTTGILVVMGELMSLRWPEGLF